MNSRKNHAKLERVVYGLKQSGRKWGHLCADTLIAGGFEHCKFGRGQRVRIIPSGGAS